LITAAITVAELGDISRFRHPKELVAYLGLVPSEHSSGESTKRGGITKTGNSHARRVLVESAWTYKHHARFTLPLIKRQEGLPKSICQISWKAQLRLCARYRKMMARKKPMQVVLIAIARELAAFMWAIAQSVGHPVPGSYIGTYGSNKPISLGGALPIGNVRPAQPASGMPEVEGLDLGPGKNLPKEVMGQPGQTLTGIDIMMFGMPVPGEQREKLQGTLGFSKKIQGTDKEQKQTAPEPEKDK